MVTGLVILGAVMLVLWSALASLRFQSMKQNELAADLAAQVEYHKGVMMDSLNKDIRRNRATMEAELQERLKPEQTQLREFLKAFYQIRFLPAEPYGGMLYKIMYTFDARVLLAARHGEQGEIRYIARHMGAMLEQELATLNIERLRKDEVEHRRVEYGRIRNPW
jgi:hypothetical protein